MGKFLWAVVDGFGRLVELAPGAPEIACSADENDVNDWLLVGADFQQAMTKHKAADPEQAKAIEYAKELVEA